MPIKCPVSDRRHRDPLDLGGDVRTGDGTVAVCNGAGGFVKIDVAALDGIGNLILRKRRNSGRGKQCA